MESENFGKNESEKISRRTFLKILTGTAAGVAVTLTLPIVSKAETSIETVTEKLNLKNGISYKDSSGREVFVEHDIERIVPAGIFSQTVLEMLCPEKLCLLAKEIEDSEKNLYSLSGKKYVTGLDESGILYKSVDNYDGMVKINEKKIKKRDADLIIDIGSNKDNQKTALTSLQELSETPTLFINAEVGKLSDSILFLGELLNCQQRAKKMASFMDDLNDLIQTKKINIEQKPKVLYVPNNSSTSENQVYSFQNEIIDMLGIEPIRFYADTSKTNNADIIIFGNWNSYNSIANKIGNNYEIWKDVKAIKNGAFAIAPGLFHSWVGSPVLVQIIGSLWLGKTVMPEIYDFDIKEYAREFYQLFYNYALSDSELSNLLGMPKTERDVLDQEKKQLIESMEQMDEVKLQTSGISAEK